MLLRTIILTTIVAFATAQTLVNSTNSQCIQTGGTNGGYCTQGQYYGCCGCCTGNSFCAGPDESPRCCPSSSSFCGCLNNQASCSGQVYNSSYTKSNSYDSFGACFDPSSGVCGQSVSAELWIVCPNNYDPCLGPSFPTCCSPGTQCNATASRLANYPICSPTPAATSSSPSSSTAQDSTANTAAILSPTSGSTLIAGKTYNFVYQTPTPSGVLYIAFFGKNSVGDGEFTPGSNQITITYTIPTTQPTGPANFSVIEQYDGSPFSNNNLYTTQQYYVLNDVSTSAPTTSAVNTQDCLPNGCAGGALCCAGQCYSTEQYTCIAQGNSYQLCPLGMQACGEACYNPSTYTCTAGQLNLA